MSKFLTNVRQIILLSVIVLLYYTLSIGSAFRESLTFDEVVHSQEGRNALVRGTFAIDTNNPPLVRELAMLPMVFGADSFIASSLPSYKLLPARLVIVFLGALLITSVYFLVKHWLGKHVAILSAFFLALEPTLLAHSHYVTLDIGASLFFFLSYCGMLLYLEKQSKIRFLFAALATGLAFASKVTLVPFFLLSSGLLWVDLHGLKKAGQKRSFAHIVLFFVIAFFVVWATYGFRTDVVIAAREGSNRVSVKLGDFAQKHNVPLLANALYIGQNQPVPLGNYLAVFKNTLVRSLSKDRTFFLGEFYPGSKWYFMLLNAGLKLPLPLLILLTVTAVILLTRATETRSLRIFFWPILAVFIVSSQGSMQPLVRYVLPAYPFLVILAAGTIVLVKNRALKLLFLFLCGWYAISSISFFPHFISYANELAGPRNKLYQKFTDSNLDWGQSLFDVQDYIQKNNPTAVHFSYFGRDDASMYGLVSDKVYGSHKQDEICAFHSLHNDLGGWRNVRLLSVSNWRACHQNEVVIKDKDPVELIGDSIIVQDL